MSIRERMRPVWQGGLIVLLVVLAYFPALHGDFLWDDDTYISANNTLRSLASFQDIWAKLGATEQYYPLTFTLFWIGYHLWGLNTFGYHLLTLSMHCVTSVLLWQVLLRLRVRGAFLAGAIFALHPVSVMSAAWMTELKNTLSGALALSAGWAYLRFAGLGVYDGGNGSGKKVVQVDWRFYALALALFQMALLAKTAVSFLPVTLFLILWWQRERLCWRDLWPLLPMLGMAIAMGQVTSYVEQHSGGASGAQFNIGFPERVLISGRSFWFYLGKIFIPWQLTFIYPRWHMNASAWWQYLYPAATFGLLWGLWKMRRRFGKGPFAAMFHFYISTSFLILVLVLFMTRYSFVSDHWQYFGCMSVIALAAAGISRGLSQFAKRSSFLKPALYGTLLLTLGVLSWRQAEIYRDKETLWRDTLSKNPECWLAHNNLGVMLKKQGHVEEALEHYRQAIQISPDYFESWNNLGVALADTGQFNEAIKDYRKAIQINPKYFEALNNLGVSLAAVGQYDEAIEAYREAIQINPNFPGALINLGTALVAKGQVSEAIGNYRQAIQINPDSAGALNNLAWTLATTLDDRLRNGDEAVHLAERACELTHYRDPSLIGTLAAAYAESGRFEDAVATARKAHDLALKLGRQKLALKDQELLQLFENHQPYREIPGQSD
jgi:protein O-mannosyl-transferase